MRRQIGGGGGGGVGGGVGGGGTQCYEILSNIMANMILLKKMFPFLLFIFVSNKF